MIKALVYTSNTGFTEEYARLLSKKTGLPCYELSEAVKERKRGDEILYLGWLMAGTVKGLKKARSRFAVKGVCGVGMSGSHEQKLDIIINNHLEDLPVFVLQGGLDLNKLTGIYKLMMKAMRAGVSKGLSEKKELTDEEKDMLDLISNGGSRVKEENLADVSTWIESQK